MRSKHVFAVAIAILALYGQAGSFGQTSQNATLEEKLEQAFQEWDRPDRLGPGAYAKVTVDGKDLLLQVPGNQSFHLAAASETEFFLEDIGAPIMFQKGPDDEVISFSVDWQGITAPKVELEELSSDQLRMYEGTYANEALEIKYKIVLRDDNLYLTSLRGKDVLLVPENQKSFSGRSSLFDLIAFTRNENGEIMGFYLDNDHLSQFIFTKLNP